MLEQYTKYDQCFHFQQFDSKGIFFAKKKNHLNRINWKNVMENSVWSEKTNKMKEIEILFHCSRILYENKYIQFKFSKKKKIFLNNDDNNDINENSEWKIKRK